MTKHIVITGASCGIGLATACYLMKQGIAVALCSRTPMADYTKQNQDLIYSSGSSVINLDLSLAESIKEAQLEIKKWCNGVLDGLVNNAGISHGGLIASTPVKKIKEIFEVNFFSHIDLTQRLFRMLVKSDNAAIVNISSIAAFMGEPGTIAYGASKLALVHATKVMASEFAAHNISVNAIAPAITETPMLKNMTESAKQKQLDLMSLKQLIKPYDLAKTIYFLLNDAPKSLTGEIIKIDGGMSFL